MRDKLNHTWKSLRPEAKKAAAATPRDTSNVAVGMAGAVVLIWILHSGFGVHVPPEVAGALGTIGGYTTGRLLRY